MNIVKDKDLIFDTEKYDAILVGTSISCMLTNGFQSKIRFKYPYIDEMNNTTKYNDKKKLGTRLTDTIHGKPYISLLYISKYPNRNRVTLDYEALENCLLTANAEFKGYKVATTVIGSSIFDGNGDKEQIMNIIANSTKDIDLYVYDYVQIDRVKEIEYQKNKLNRLKAIDMEKYNRLWNVREDMFKKMFLK